MDVVLSKSSTWELLLLNDEIGKTSRGLVNFTTSTGLEGQGVGTSLPAAALVEVTNGEVRNTTDCSERQERWKRLNDKPCGEVQCERDEQCNHSPADQLVFELRWIQRGPPSQFDRPVVACCPTLSRGEVDATGADSGQHSEMSDDTDQIDRQALVSELRLLRERGLAQLPKLELNEMARVARLIDPDPETDDRARIESSLRRAVEQLGGGPYGEAGGLLFGLIQGTRAHSSRVRREEAAAAIDKVADTFRKSYEPAMIEEIADNLIGLRASQQARNVWAEMEQRHPADSRLAVHWVERFESYYRMWTPIYALAADLTAARSTMLEEDRPYDRAPGTEGEDDPGYSQEDQAAGYAAFALYRYASLQCELQQFMVRHGGLWLFASTEAEVAVRDAVYRIGWHVTPFNERDDSWLRLTMGEGPNHEMHSFLSKVSMSSIGRTTMDEWLAWVVSCSCTWSAEDVEASYFPVPAAASGISDLCQLHQTIRACGDFCARIDAEWVQVADWYHLDEQHRRSESGENLYSVIRRN